MNTVAEIMIELKKKENVARINTFVKHGAHQTAFRGFGPLCFLR